MIRQIHTLAVIAAAMGAFACKRPATETQPSPQNQPQPAAAGDVKPAAKAPSPKETSDATKNITPPPPEQPVPAPAAGSTTTPAQPPVPESGVRDLRPKLDYAVMARDYRVAALKGDARAQAELGKLYWAGAGVERSPEQAVEWLRKAAEQGDADAQFYLGRAYEFGFGIAKDDAEALRWKQKALAQGYQPKLPSAGSRARPPQP